MTEFKPIPAVVTPFSVISVQFPTNRAPDDPDPEPEPPHPAAKERTTKQMAIVRARLSIVLSLASIDG